MITALNWKDYEVIDASCGEKLERWGKYVLLRPDPQVIWKTPKKDPLWENPDGHYHRSSKGGGSWEIFDLPEQWKVHYNTPCGKLTFNLKAFSFKHTGVFPEQAANWDWFSYLIKQRISEGKAVNVLNLFAYTGGATMAAAKAGARVTHVDSSRGMITWSRENAEASNIPKESLRWIAEDCRKFIEREIRRGNKYEAVIMDPPSYGRGTKGEVWKIEEDLYDFIGLTSKVLSDDPLFFLVNSYTTGPQPGALEYILESTVVKDHGGRITADEVGLPVKDSGLILPCGACARWEK